jgi:hypothetical protein
VARAFQHEVKIEMLDYESIPPPQGPTAPRGLVWYLWLMPLITGVALCWVIFGQGGTDVGPTELIIGITIVASPYLCAFGLGFWAARSRPWSPLNTLFLPIALTLIYIAGLAATAYVIYFAPPDAQNALISLSVLVLQWLALVPTIAIALGINSAYRRLLRRRPRS